MFLSDSGLSNRIYWKAKTIVYDNIDSISTNIEMGVGGHTLEEIKACLKEIEMSIAKLEKSAKLIQTESDTVNYDARRRR